MNTWLFLTRQGFDTQLTERTQPTARVQPAPSTKAGTLVTHIVLNTPRGTFVSHQVQGFTRSWRVSDFGHIRFPSDWHLS